MKIDQNKINAAKACFAFNKLINVCHVTSDLECFEDRSHAVNHARAQEDKSIEVFNRGDEDQPANDLLDSFRESSAAKTKPDAALAGQKRGGKAKDTTFEQVQQDKPKEDQKPPAEIYGSEGEKGLTATQLQTTIPAKTKGAKAKKAAKEPAPKKVKTVTPAEIKPAAEKPADEKPADQQQSEENPA